MRRTPVRAVFLVGFMGAGKTAVGRALSARLGWRFEDLDVRIEGAERRTIAEIFRDSGEAQFRKLEHAALRDLVTGSASAEPLVAALGGGAFVQTENAALLGSEETPTVFLDTPVEELWSRCATPGEPERPLRADQERFRALFAARLPRYREARLRVQTEGKSVDQIAEEVIDRLALRGTGPDKEK